MNTTRSLRAFQRTFEQAFRTHHTPIRIPHQPKIRAFQISPQRIQLRHQSTDTHTPQPLTNRTETSQSDADAIATRKALSPAYQLHFTCKKCLERSAHTISKQAYHFGTTVINCPKCKTQHLISDHLKIFSDKSKTLEDIAKEHGELLKRGKLGVDGDVEFYDDAATGIVEEDSRKLREGRDPNWKKNAQEGEGKAQHENEASTVEDLKAKVETQSEEEKAMDDRIREALRETSRRQDG